MRNRIAEVRQAAGLSQQQLVELSGIPRRTLQMWENNQTAPDIYKAYQLAKTLNCTIEDLLVIEENEENEEKPE